MVKVWIPGNRILLAYSNQKNIVQVNHFLFQLKQLFFMGYINP